MKKIIHTDKAPKAIGPYSQAVMAGDFLFCSGQISPTESDVAEQTRQILENISAVLEAAGCSLSQVIKTTVFLKNMSDFAAMNEVYGEYFKIDPPARSTVEVARLPKEALVEIESTALICV